VQNNVAGHNAEAASERAKGKSSQSIMYSAIQAATKQEVALLLLDIVGSTKLILKQGDTAFSTLIGGLFRQVRKHAASSELVLLKSTGDGYLAVFQSASAAFALAKTYLEQPLQPTIHFKIALHWGMVNIGPNGDVLGTEVRRVFRIEQLQKEDRIESNGSAVSDFSTNFSTNDCVIATKSAIDQLSRPEQQQFQSAGIFRLNLPGEDSCTLLIWRPPTKLS
jgi:class 3 adenylate cyclase